MKTEMRNKAIATKDLWRQYGLRMTIWFYLICVLFLFSVSFDLGAEEAPSGKTHDPQAQTKIVTVSGKVIKIPSKANIAIPSENHVRMYYFYSSNCRECLEIKDSFIPALNEKYSFRLEVKYFEITNTENYKFQLELEKKFRQVKKSPPAVFIGSHVLDGKEEIKENLERLIENCISDGGCDWPPVAALDKGNQTDESVIKRFKDLGILVVIGAGLLDGLNPCAFTTIVFLISYLALIGRKSSELLVVGCVFTLGVFAAYLLIGLGLFEFTEKLVFFPILNRVISYLMAGAACMLGILSIYDYYKIKKGKMSDIALQLPKSVKKKIHFAIREKSRIRHFILVSVVMGFLVAFLEFPCTGQVYLPIVFVVRHISEIRSNAMLYMVLYNLMFVIPLIVVFVFAYKGTSSVVFAKLMRKGAGKVKILTALLFFTLSALLIVRHILP